MSQSTRDPYSILRVSPDSTEEEINSAYKTCMRLLHPDKHSNNTEDTRKAEAFAYDFNWARKEAIRRKGWEKTGRRADHRAPPHNAESTSSSIPDPPSTVSVVARSHSASLSWSRVLGASTYNVYCFAPGSEIKAGSPMANSASSPCDVRGLENGVAYIFSVTALGAWGETRLSVPVTTVPKGVPPVIPVLTHAHPGEEPNSIIVQWKEVPGASYMLYWSASPGVEKRNSWNLHLNQPFFSHRNIPGNVIRCYYAVAALNEDGESALSNEMASEPFRRSYHKTIAITAGVGFCLLALYAFLPGSKPKSPSSREVQEEKAQSRNFSQTSSPSKKTQVAQQSQQGYGVIPRSGPKDKPNSTPLLIPNPEISVTLDSDRTGLGRGSVYRIKVLNYKEFPDELFARAPHLPPCGLNSNSSRTWAEIFDAGGSRIYGFCALEKSENLNKMWFGVGEGRQVPVAVYIKLVDRQTRKEYQSASVIVPPYPLVEVGSK